MPTHYCSTTGCGNRITYLTEKPKVCPKCGTAITDLTKIVARATKAAVKVSRVEDDIIDDEDDPLIPPVRSSKSKPIIRKTPLRQRPIQASIPEQEDVEEEEEDEDIDEEPFNPREARRLARELAASIDPSTINVGLEGGDIDDKITFKDWCVNK